MRKHLTSKNKFIIIITICLMAVSVGGNSNVLGNENASTALSYSDEKSSDLYSTIRDNWSNEGYTEAQNTEISIPVLQYSNAAEETTVHSGDLEGKSNVLTMEERSWVEYKINVPQTGLYTIDMEYLPIREESTIPLQVGIQINGEYQYTEASNIALHRKWRDADNPPKRDHRDNEIRPGQAEIRGWLTQSLRDSTYAHREPLRFLLHQGEQTIRIETIYESLALSEIIIGSPKVIASYEEVQASYPTVESASNPDWYEVIEAEQMTSKSEPAVQMQASRDDLAKPESDGQIIFNTMGGDRWTRGGQMAEWTFTVPEDGLYHIDIKFSQPYYREISTFREIRIDNEVPFEELLTYPFQYGRNWQEETLQDADGNPFLFYLTEGTHTISLSVSNAPITPVIEALHSFLNEVQVMNRTIRLVTGAQDSEYIDRNRDWDLEQFMPDIKERFLFMKEDLEQRLAYMQDLYGNELNTASALRSAADELEKLAEDPNVLPYQPDKLSTLQESISAYIQQLNLQPLMLDQIYISQHTAELPRIAPTTWEVVSNSVKTFFLTFSENYFDYGRQDEDANLTVWINRGRDYVSLLQNMTDEMFTPETGIKVNVNIMPNPELLILSNSAGREPDIALGIDMLTPVDFALRNNLVDLSQFDDYEEVASQFHPGALLAYHYNGGDYALPETKTFNIMFYRQDILDELGIEIPNTWEEVYDLLPTMQQNGYDFFIDPLFYQPFFYQNGVEFYTEDGLRTGLDTPTAFDAFKQWTDLFNIYGFPRQVPSFYMHFRNGNMPIGISDFNNYLQLLVAAPEITGSWGIAPMPGIENEEGEIERWAGGMLEAGMIFKSTENPEMAWDFLKWWTSTETQVRYGTDIEMFNGIEFRWNTANLEAFQQLPWPEEHSEEIMKQYRWFKEVPNVPGGYFTPREVQFGWNRSVLSNINYRESLEESIFEINRELLRKQQEFGIVDENGNVQFELDIPQITEPWDGGAR